MIWIIGFPRPTGFLLNWNPHLDTLCEYFEMKVYTIQSVFQFFKGLPMWSCWIWPLPRLRKKGHSKGSPQVAPWYVTLPEANSSPENDGWKMTFPFGARPSFKGDVLLVKRSVNSRCTPPAILQVKEGQGWNQWIRLRRYPRREKKRHESPKKTRVNAVIWLSGVGMLGTFFFSEVDWRVLDSNTKKVNSYSFVDVYSVIIRLVGFWTW